MTETTIPLEEEYSLSGDVKHGIVGLDELALELGVEEPSDGNGLQLLGSSGKYYDLVELLAAHVKLIKEVV